MQFDVKHLVLALLGPILGALLVAAETQAPGLGASVCANVPAASAGK